MLVELGIAIYLASYLIKDEEQTQQPLEEEEMLNDNYEEWWDD